MSPKFGEVQGDITSKLVGNRGKDHSISVPFSHLIISNGGIRHVWVANYMICLKIQIKQKGIFILRRKSTHIIKGSCSNQPKLQVKCLEEHLSSRLTWDSHAKLN